MSRLHLLGMWLLLMTTSSVIAQIRLSGLVLRDGDDQPVSFANIGIVNTDVGTLADEDGTFSLEIPERYRRAKLLFSALGYRKVFVSIDSLAGGDDIVMKLIEEVVSLRPVTVTADKFNKKSRLGNDVAEGGTVYTDVVMAGSAMALLIDKESIIGPSSRFAYPALVEKAAVSIAENTFQEFKVRVRILDVDPVTGGPGKDLLNKSVIISSRIRKGWLEVDLLEHFLSVDGPFYLAFEWILERRDRQYLYEQYTNWRLRHPELVTVDYSEVDGEKVPYLNYNSSFWAGTSFGIAVSQDFLDDYKCYYRYSSFSKWTRSSSIMTATVVLGN